MKHLHIVAEGHSEEEFVRKVLTDHASQKSIVGPIVAEDIGIQRLKMRCKHFDEWVSKLEGLNS